ncbi:MAG: DnaA/Hda family protein [Candidatus Eisenbacteria bacterium]|nr:DnaA/Hda family protein [Candidatus Eisenbacteria bacterium]
MSERVLVVDDDPVMRELLRAVFAQAGMTVLEAEDGQEGLEEIRGERPDLVLSDVMMPIMDGFELVRRVRSDPLLASTPLIILSAKGEEEDRIKGLELGANDYMTKPFSGKELVARVRGTIRYRDMVRLQRAPLSDGPFAAKGLEHLAQLTFQTFVPGTGNRSAYEACLAAAENPGKRFNPLFLYGGPGMGKTHMMCALANEVFRRNNAVKLLYLTSEVFSSQIIDAYRDRQVTQLRDQYLQADVMLVDDIQFLAISPSMQTVAADLLAVMYDKGKQIVISSDRRPEELQALTTEISTAFALGLVVRIDQPDATLRTSILRATAQRNNWAVDVAMLDYLAANLESDLRTLGGLAKRLVALKTLSGTAISREIVDDLIAEVTGPPGTDMPPESPAGKASPVPAASSPDAAAPPAPGAGEPPAHPALAFQDPLAAEFTPLASLTRVLGGFRDAAMALACLKARPVIVLGTSPTLALDTVDMLAESRKRSVTLPEGDEWAYVVHVQREAPSWVLVALPGWREGTEVTRMLPADRNPAFLIVLDSMSPKVMEARQLIDGLPATCGMAVVVLVPTLTDDSSERTVETLSRSMRRLFKVKACAPLIVSPRLTTAATRNWLHMASEPPPT